MLVEDLREIETKLRDLHGRQGACMAEIDDLRTATQKLVADISAYVSDAKASSVALHTQLDAAIAAGTASAAELDALKASAVDLTAQLTAADAAVQAAAASS